MIRGGVRPVNVRPEKLALGERDRERERGRETGRKEESKRIVGRGSPERVVAARGNVSFFRIPSEHRTGLIDFHGT